MISSDSFARRPLWEDGLGMFLLLSDELSFVEFPIHPKTIGNWQSTSPNYHLCVFHLSDTVQVMALVRCMDLESSLSDIRAGHFLNVHEGASFPTTTKVKIIYSIQVRMELVCA